MIVLALDPGSHVSGWSIFEDGKLTHCGKIDVTRDIKQRLDLKSKDKVEMSQRLGELMQFVDTLIDEYGPSELVVESQFVGKNANTAMITARAMGVAVAVGASKGLSVYEYAPMEIKKAVSGKGNATKEEVAEAILMAYPHLENEIGAFKCTTKDKNDDTYDAIGINMTHALLGNKDEELDNVA